MTAWITVFCREPVDHLSPADLQAALLESGLWARAAELGLADATVDAALPFIKVERVEADHYQIQYQAPGLPKIDVWRWSQGERMNDELDELAPDLPGGQLGRRIRSGLDELVEIIGIEFAWSEGADMALVLAYEAARFLGAEGKAIIRGDDDHWSRIREGRFTELA